MIAISFVVPCYNSQDYMDKCVQSILTCGNDIEIIIINDGSTDTTLHKARDWEQRYPEIIKVVDKKNGGHGSAVNAGLEVAAGLYFKVVDSDDWIDPAAASHVMAYVRTQLIAAQPTDLIITNYVYDKVDEGRHTSMRYRNVFPVQEKITWEQSRRFRISQYLLMHSLLYRTAILKQINLQLPEHCFYVDNIFAYVPLPHVKTLYYLDVDLYHYYIGRENQSVTESIMLSRIDQQLKISRVMIDAVDLTCDVKSPKLARYMENYLGMMMCINSLFLRMKPTEESMKKLADIWAYLKSRNETTYTHLRYSLINASANLPGEAGRRLALGGYHIAQKVFKFN